VALERLGDVLDDVKVTGRVKEVSGHDHDGRDVDLIEELLELARGGRIGIAARRQRQIAHDLSALTVRQRNGQTLSDTHVA